jgi:hypothetical protein
MWGAVGGRIEGWRGAGRAWTTWPPAFLSPDQLIGDTWQSAGGIADGTCRSLVSAQRNRPHNLEVSNALAPEVEVIARAIVGVALVALMVAGCSLLPGPVVRIEEGVSPRMSPNEVSDLVIERLQAMEQAVGHAATPPRILSMTATTAAGIARLEPHAGQGQAPAPGIEWLVRAEGTFVNNRTPPVAEPMVATSGYFVISDADGSILGFGFS